MMYHKRKELAMNGQNLEKIYLIESKIVIELIAGRGQEPKRE